MIYCTQDDLVQAISLQTLIWLSNDDTAATAPDDTVLERAVSQAEERIDGYLRQRYVLPLSPVPTTICDITVTFARFWLYSRRPEGAELPKAVVMAYEQANKDLAAIRDGRQSLGVQTTGLPQPEAGQMAMRSTRKAFDHERLRRY
jgi:phage gp36-like protein